MFDSSLRYKVNAPTGISPLISSSICHVAGGVDYTLLSISCGILSDDFDSTYCGEPESRLELLTAL